MDQPYNANTLTSTQLQDLWFVQSSGAGWVFASDWYHPAVEALCEACLRGEQLWATAERLGSVRADAGVSLGETLADIDGLTTVLPGLPADILQRAVSLGWADSMTSPAPNVFDPLTGLVSEDYLRTRLGEVYRGCEVDGQHASVRHALVVVRVDLTGRRGWDRMTPLILSGDAMRTVFAGAQTLARLSDEMAVVLCDREDMLPRRARLLSDMVTERLNRDPDDAPSVPRVWIEQLPDSVLAAIDLISELSR